MRASVHVLAASSGGGAVSGLSSARISSRFTRRTNASSSASQAASRPGGASVGDMRASEGNKSASRFACVPSVVTGRGARVGVGSRGAPRLGKDDRKRPSGRVERFGSLAAVGALSRSSSGNRETERTRNQRNERTKGAFDPQVDDPTETPATFDRSPLSSKISPNVGEDRNGLLTTVFTTR